MVRIIKTIGEGKWLRKRRARGTRERLYGKRSYTGGRPFHSTCGAISKRNAERSMIRGLLAGILLGVIAVMAGTYWYFSSGRAPVAVTASEMPFERRLARLGLHAYLDKLPHPGPQV